MKKNTIMTCLLMMAHLTYPCVADEEYIHDDMDSTPEDERAEKMLELNDQAAFAEHAKNDENTIVRDVASRRLSTLNKKEGEEVK